MRFRRTIQGTINLLFQFSRRQFSTRLYNSPFPMYPFWFNRIQPGAFGWQGTHPDANTLSQHRHLAIMFSNPVSNIFADMPGSVIPDQDQNPFTLGLKFFATPFQILSGQYTDWAIIDKTQQNFFVPIALNLRAMTHPRLLT